MHENDDDCNGNRKCHGSKVCTHGTVSRHVGNGGSISMANLNLKSNCGATAS